uniref:uncharacterized protein LOC100179376 n=1 Tax=Ciona intestinalis TaxID=7719 RepID=UPI000EF47072|nr:uncharacterized protein LOC100179376 [Ciona intestinalis]|eukprot:XP_026694814.1 uncharacterized protein LOC100179376 [Ciona intestinalis]
MFPVLCNSQVIGVITKINKVMSRQPLIDRSNEKVGVSNTSAAQSDSQKAYFNQNFNKYGTINVDAAVIDETITQVVDEDPNNQQDEPQPTEVQLQQNVLEQKAHLEKLKEIVQKKKFDSVIKPEWEEFIYEKWKNYGGYAELVMFLFQCLMAIVWTIFPVRVSWYKRRNSAVIARNVLATVVTVVHTGMMIIHNKRKEPSKPQQKLFVSIMQWLWHWFKPGFKLLKILLLFTTTNLHG